VSKSEVPIKTNVKNSKSRAKINPNIAQIEIPIMMGRNNVYLRIVAIQLIFCVIKVVAIFY
jgi:hypothetical protein